MSGMGMQANMYGAQAASSAGMFGSFMGALGGIFGGPIGAGVAGAIFK